MAKFCPMPPARSFIHILIRFPKYFREGPMEGDGTKRMRKERGHKWRREKEGE